MQTTLKILLFVPNLVKELGAYLISQLSRERINRQSPIYSPNRPASEKLDKQLKFADEQRKSQAPKNFSRTCDPKVTGSYSKGVPKDEEFQVKTRGTGDAGEAHVQGMREEMEDAAGLWTLTLQVRGQTIQAQLYGVFDGHGGGQASQYCAENLGDRLKTILEKVEELTDETITNSLTQAFLDINKECIDKNLSGGTTATCVLRINGKIYIPNVGDSRTILVASDKTTQLTEDAKISLKRFSNAIQKAGIEIKNNRAYYAPPFRLSLAVARDLGLSENLSARPKITKIDEVKGDYLILACDGLWDVASTDEVGEAVRQMAKEGLDPAQISENLTKAAILNQSRDNVSVMVIKL